MQFKEISELNGWIGSREVGIVIGNFDGVHLGHQDLLHEFFKECRALEITPLLITFDPHPFLVVNPDKCSFQLITPREEKRLLLRKCGIEAVWTIRFDQKIQKLSPLEFIRSYLLKITNLKLIYLGHDFQLGKGKVGAQEILTQELSGRSILLKEKLAYMLKGKIVSSSLIRSLVDRDIEKANDYLGRSFSISGNVVHGNQLGTKINFPTANLAVDDVQLVPSTGVYISKAVVNGVEYEAVTNVGLNPTVSDTNSTKIETHLFHFNQKIYNQTIELKFLKKLRNELQFDGLDALASQIAKDVGVAVNYFKGKNNLHLALVGRDISHSKSQSMYEEILHKSIDYTLLDYKDESEISTLTELKSKFDGVSVTSPYKKHFLDKVDELVPPDLTSINVIRFIKGKSIGGNTDLLAINDILSQYLKDGVTDISILGDGTMSLLTQDCLKSIGMEFEVYSRKLLNIDDVAQVFYEKKSSSLIINCCSREYKFPVDKKGQYHFWDMNYMLEHHIQAFKNTSIDYQDGMKMLKLQAKYALSFWNLSSQ